MPVEQALEQLLALAEAAPIRDTENLPLAEAEGRVLATHLVASLDLPPWPNSAMDGYALRLADWQGEPLPVSQRIFAGHPPQPLQPVPAHASSPGHRCPKVPTASRCRKTPKWRRMGGYAFSKR